MIANSEEKNQGLIEHLTELRVCLVRSLQIIFVAAIACYTVSEKIFDVIRSPIAPYLPAGGLVFTAPADKFIAHLKISFFSGVILSCPLWLYQVWRFIAPGLYEREKKYATTFIFSGTLLFVMGILFCYFLVLPAAFHFLMDFGGSVDKPMITISEYLSFVLILCVMFGLSFELPLVITMLGLMGLVSAAFLRRNRRYSAVGIAVFAAIVTPPDLLSMLFLLVPMMVLYEVSILIVASFEKKRIAELQQQ